MKMTIHIDDVVARAVLERAARDGASAGRILSGLARQALNTMNSAAPAEIPRVVLGFRPFPKRGQVVTNEIIDSLRMGDVY